MIKLEEGSAEVFGAELMKFKSYKFSGAKFAIYTWDGCVLTIKIFKCSCTRNLMSITNTGVLRALT